MKKFCEKNFLEYTFAMGFKLNLILGGLLVASLAGSSVYIKYLNNQLATLKGNQIVLEGKIAEQNESIKNYLEDQQKNQAQITALTQKNQQNQREVQKLRNTFAKHDMDSLALAKPGLIQTRVNKGTLRVKEDLIAITNPEQFDEEPITD